MIAYYDRPLRALVRSEGASAGEQRIASLRCEVLSFLEKRLQTRKVPSRVAECLPCIIFFATGNLSDKEH